MAAAAHSLTAPYHHPLSHNLFPCVYNFLCTILIIIIIPPHCHVSLTASQQVVETEDDRLLFLRQPQQFGWVQAAPYSFSTTLIVPQSNQYSKQQILLKILDDLFWRLPSVRMIRSSSFAFGSS